MMWLKLYQISSAALTMFQLFPEKTTTFEPRCEKTGLRVSDQVRTDHGVQPQKMVRGLKFRI